MKSQDRTQEQTQTIASRYSKVLLGPVLAAGLFEIAGSQQPNANTLLFFTNGALIIAVLWKCRHEHANWETASIVGALCGGAATFLLALVTLMTNFHVARIFNLITQPIFTGILVGVTTGFIYTVLQLASAQKRKGGDLS